MARYDESLKTKALAIAETAGAAEASRATGIPDVTIRVWLHRVKRNGGNGAKNDNGNGETKRNGITVYNGGAAELRIKAETRDERRSESVEAAELDVSGLTPRQARFVQEYLIDLNGTQAAIRAGYSPRTANRQGARLLSYAGIQAAIQNAMKQREKRTEITADRVVKELAKIAFADLKDFVEFGPDGVRIKNDKDVDGTLLIEVSETTFKGATTRAVKLHPKIKALELLGKHLGIFVNKHELSGPGGGPVQWVDLVKLAQSAGETGGVDADHADRGDANAVERPSKS